MSGNPFRRPQPPPLNLTPAETRFPQQDETPADNARRSSKTKRVRIATPPPISPDPETPTEEETTIQRVADESHTGSPPPVLDSNGAQTDPFAQAYPDVMKLQSQEVQENTRRNSGADSSSPPIPDPRFTGVPVNPFAKTLATMESSIGKGPDRASITTRNNANGMDVDAFTKMLLCGSNSQQNAGDQAPKVSGPARSEPYNAEKLRADSPPGISASESDEELEEEVKQSQHPSTSSTRVKPPPPAHRHGKSVSDRKPQTVAFDGFGIEEHSQSVARPLPSTTSSSDYGKALPNIPKGGAQSSVVASTQQANTVNASSVRPAKPPPPPSRRGARPNPLAGTDSPESASISSERDIETAPRRKAMTTALGDNVSRSSSQHSQRVSLPPPPPPRRRRGSSKSSLDAASIRQLSHESVTHIAGGSTGLERSNAEGRSGGSKVNVLDDLAALQAEVDALRAQQRN